MDQMKITHFLILALAWSFTARADFRYTTTTHDPQAAALRPGTDPQVTRYYFKGSRVLSESGDIARIVDLNAQTATVINKAARTYTVHKLSETPPPEIAAMGLHRQIGMKETGEQKTINGYACRQIIVTLSLDAPSPASRGTGIRIEMDVWVSSDVPGWKNMRAFEQNNGNYFFVQTTRENVITEFLKLSGMNGFPVQTIMHGGGTGLTATQITQMRAPLEKAIEAGGQRPEAAKQALDRMSGGANGEAGIEIAQVYSDFSDADLSDVLFDIPAGFTKTGQ
jgi:hypothetical protein